MGDVHVRSGAGMFVLRHQGGELEVRLGRGRLHRLGLRSSASTRCEYRPLGEVRHHPGVTSPTHRDRSSGRDAVADVYRTVAEPALVEELEVGTLVAWKRGLAAAEE